MSNNYCICTRCGHKEVAVEGIPCTMRTCIECAGLMEEITEEEAATLPEKSGDITLVHKGQAVIDYESCTTCGACINSCLYGMIQMTDGKPIVDPNGCFGCLACSLSCPAGAISL
jgi:heterodisulfide reductase subunit A-like polyferredoxin